ncbi:MAG: hypothetical protein LUH63_14425 [Parabacteroides sp.]|nr:hypothetical protein [Parabacteroides sp.]
MLFISVPAWGDQTISNSTKWTNQTIEGTITINGTVTITLEGENKITGGLIVPAGSELILSSSTVGKLEATYIGSDNKGNDPASGNGYSSDACGNISISCCLIKAGYIGSGTAGNARSGGTAGNGGACGNITVQNSLIYAGDHLGAGNGGGECR